jgi:NADH-quinone oxidoreductase subunit L
MSLVLVAVFGPLAAALSILLLRRAAPQLALLGTGASAVAAWSILASVSAGERYTAAYAWLPGLPLFLVIDPLAALLSVTVASVGFLVLLYAVGYMEDAGGKARFYAAMSLFLAAMQTLVIAGDWLLLLASWELIGLASYLLIAHRHQRADARLAASRAFLTTRVADVGMYIAVFLLISETGSTRILQPLGSDGTTAALAGLLLLLAAAGKAAQVPFQGWLAAAMAGPTPVSALLHSATLVAAGVILMLRAFPLLPETVLLAVAVLGGTTAMVAGLTALAQRDLKRLLAASTSSQLGLMLLGLGAGSPAAAAFHLLTHAAMKSALFLGAGVFQQQRGSTELGRLRGVGRERGIAFVGFAAAALALAGLPPMAGFWSKDAILAASFESVHPWLLVPPALLGSLLTAMYMARSLRLLWQVSSPSIEKATSSASGGQRDGRAGNGTRRAGEGTSSGRVDGHEAPDGGTRALVWMGAGLGALSIAAVVLGLLVGPLESFLGVEFPESVTAIVLGVAVTLTGLLVGWLLPAERLLGGLRPLAESGFRLAGGMSAFIVRPALRLASLADRSSRRADSLVRTVAANAMAVSALADPVSDALLEVAFAAAGRALRTADLAASGDSALHRLVDGTARATLSAGRLVRAGDQRGIEALIASLAQQTRELGRAARSLQSGLVHRHLALTVGGGAALLALLVFVGVTIQ